MIFSGRTTACTALLLLVSTALVFASPAPYHVVIKTDSEEVDAIRYQTGTNSQGAWTEVDASQPILVLQNFDSTQDILFVQQKAIGQSWGSGWEYRYDAETGQWKETSQPVSSEKRFITTMDVAPYVLFPVGSSSSLYSYLIGSSLTFNLNVGERLPLFAYGEVGYSRGPCQSDWVDTMQAVNISTGVGYHLRMGKCVELTPKLGYGLVLHILQADFDQDGTKAHEFFIDQQLRLSLAFSYELSKSYELFAAPLGVLLFENTTVALLLGLQAGIYYTF